MKKKVSLITALALSTSVLVAGCGNGEKASTTEQGKEGNVALADKQVLNLLETAEIPSMDTSKATDGVSFRVFVNAMEGLYRLDKENKPTPGMAKDVKISEDKKTYTFHLRDTKWSNGEPVKAQDFVFAWRRAVDKATASEYAFILFDVKNAEKINKGELPLEQLGVTAKDDKTLVVELEKPTPYFLDLTTFPTFFPLNEKYVKEQGDKYSLESDKLLYNGPFVMSEWKHERSYQLKKNPNYWDKDNVKLEEINVSVVKETSTGVNLYDSNEVDRVILSSEFVDKYKKSDEFKLELDSRMYFIRFNQKNQIFSNKKARQAIDLSYDKKGIANVILNDGSLPAYYLVAQKFTKGPDGKDFRETNKNFHDGKGNAAKAKKLWEEAKKELGQDTITVEMLNYDKDNLKKVGEYIKAELEKNLPGLKVNMKQQPFKQKLELEKKLEYEFSLSSWGPDYPDPMTFIDMFITDSAFNEMAYSNKKYDELVAKAKGELLTDEKARWKALSEAEKILFDDAAISPVYQQGVAFLEKSKVKGTAKHTFGGDFSYKWTYITKK
ncbi:MULTISPECIES: peptide ABC transporter substrate-binding protein [unclassified Bacillus (in: firmicutes)]|uniref:peptide ABC transporter substrate-binding protein n=1 Tax=unclassified Bacillus (in: firmicutes) TaxID=185979 RepID=UPI0008ED0D4D|nr:MULTISPECIES: peptide ABC transporter substrate-binding protein [unclassified Bacillus (in: firmicutes)]SFI04747.1 peptide/nickel transport system substrate-binding protein [Bacillus sp. 71mf]SFS79998.1 peptide/nickel transport system substrate-binding protein [Bacillus sp. 103mf]